MPPNRLTTSSTSSSAFRSFTEDHLLSLPEHPLRAERHQSDQQQPGDRQAEGGNPGLRERRVGQVDEPGALEHEPEQDRADEYTLVVGHPPEDQDAEGEERDRRLKVEGMQGAQVQRQEEARDR